MADTPPPANTKGVFRKGSKTFPMIFKGVVKKFGTEPHWTFVSPNAQGNFKNFPLYEKNKEYGWSFTPNAPKECKSGMCTVMRKSRRQRKNRKQTRKNRRN